MVLGNMWGDIAAVESHVQSDEALSQVKFNLLFNVKYF
jgi:hypothetical protein